MNRRELVKSLISVVGSMKLMLQKAGAVAAEPLVSGRYEVQSSLLSVELNEQGEIDELVFRSDPTRVFKRKILARTVLTECSVRRSEARKLADGSVEFSKTLTDDGGKRSCHLHERFMPTSSGSIRWEIEIVGEGEPWSAPIETHLSWPATDETKFWTTCGDSRPKGAPGWNDPLIPSAFAERTLSYGGKTVEGDLCFSVPVATVLETRDDVGLSLALSPAETVPEMNLSTTSDGTIVFSRLYSRIGKTGPVRFTVDLVAHPADWRGGLGWMVAQYRQYFDPPNPLTYQVGGLGAYSEYEGDLDAYKFMSMGFRFNWKAGYDFPYMGMFLPPVSDDEEWVCNRATTGTPEFPTSISRLRRYSERMRQSGFHVLNYLNACEFGENIHEVKRLTKPDPNRDRDLWRDPSEFVFNVLGDAIMRGPDGKVLNGWQNDALMDPGEPVYERFLLEQARLHIEKFPASSGLCFDEMQYLRAYNVQRDDGITWKDARPARSLVVSWRDLMSKMGPFMHGANKVIYCNPLYRRLDLMDQMDGFYDEICTLPESLNASAFMALRKPHVVWTNNIVNPDPDAYFQRHLYMGAYLSAPIPVNNHDIMPCGPAVDQYYVDYGPMFDALQGRRWVLDPHVIEVEGQHAKANLFSIPGGYLAVVAMGGTKPDARISLRNLDRLPGQKNFVIEAIQPGQAKWTPISSIEHGDSLTVVVPLQRGCAMVRLLYAWIKPEKHYFIDTLTVNLGTTIQTAKIHYSLDGRKPGPDSPVYSEPFTVDRSTMLTAAVFQNGAQTGSVLTAELVKMLPPAPWIYPFDTSFKDSIKVELRQPYSIAGSEIRYRLDSSEVPNLSYGPLALPALQNATLLDDGATLTSGEVTSQSPLYTGPFELSANTSIRARTFVPGLEPSTTAEGIFSKLPPLSPLPNVYVSDLVPLSSVLPDGNLKNNRSIGGTPLSVHGKRYEHGLGVCSPSKVIYKLEPEYGFFVAEVGLHDATMDSTSLLINGRNAARAAFQVYVRNDREQVLLYATPLLYPGESWPIEVRIPFSLGYREISLVSNGSTSWDPADWVNAGFLLDASYGH